MKRRETVAWLLVGALATALVLSFLLHPRPPRFPMMPPPDAFPDGPPALPSELPPVRPEDEQLFIEWTRTNDPDSLADINAIKRERPELYRRIVVEGLMQRAFLQEMERRDPQHYQSALHEFKLDSRSRRLARQCRQASEAERQALVQQLDGVLNELFDVREKNRMHRLERMRAELARVESGLADRRNRKAELVSKRRAELLQDPSIHWRIK